MGKSNNKLVLIVLFQFIFIHNMNSQSMEYSRQNILNNNDSLAKVYLYHQMINKLKATSLDEAISLNRKALALANRVNSPEARGETNELMGELYGKKNNIQPAINYYLISAKIFEELQDFRKLSSIYGNLGMLYYNNNYDTERTLNYYRMSLDFAVKINDQTLIAEAYNRIGRILFNQQNYIDALYYFESTLNIASDLDDNKIKAIALNNIGEVYRMEKKYDKALSYYRLSIETNTNTIKDLGLKAISLENIGQVFSATNKISKAFEYYKNSLAVYDSIDDIDGLSELYILLGDEYLKSNEISNAYESYNNAYNIAVKHNKWKQIKNSSLGLSKVFEFKNDHQKALEYILMYAKYNDTIIKKQMSDEIYDLQSHFIRDIREKEIQIKDSQIELLESRQKISKLQQNILIAGVIFILIISAITIIRTRKRVKKEKLINQQNHELHKAQKELLKMEISSKTNDLTTFALHIVQKNLILNQLKSDLHKLAKSADNELNSKLKELAVHVQQSLHINKEIEEFKNKVDATYGDFFKNLNNRFPTLTKNEKRLCVLLRLNLSTKEIASLNNISIKAVEMSRYRLRKKCKLSNDESLHEYMQNI